MTVRKALLVLAISLYPATLSPGAAAQHNTPSCNNVTLETCMNLLGWSAVGSWSTSDRDFYTRMFYLTRWRSTPLQCITTRNNLGSVLLGSQVTFLWGNHNNDAGNHVPITTDGGRTNVIIVNRNLSIPETFQTLTHESAHEFGFGDTGTWSAYQQESCFVGFAWMSPSDIISDETRDLIAHMRKNPLKPVL